MNKPEELDALLDIYLFSEIDDEDALDDFLKINKIDFDSFRKKIEEVLKLRIIKREHGAKKTNIES